MCPLDCGCQLIGNEMSQGTSFWYSHKNLGKYIWNQRSPPPGPTLTYIFWEFNFLSGSVQGSHTSRTNFHFDRCGSDIVQGRRLRETGTFMEAWGMTALFLHNLNNTAAFFGMTSRGQGILCPTENSSRKARVTRELSWLILLPLLFICLHQARYH